MSMGTFGKYFALLYLLVFLSAGMGTTSCSTKKKSATEKRMKKQEKHRKSHPCPHLDC
jgi:hypothetical protein